MKKTDPHFDANRVAHTLHHDLGLPAGASIVVAYSGGLDSTVLLHALNHIKKEYQWMLRAVHINHGLQSEADQWSEFCQQVCREWGIPLTNVKVQVDQNHKDGLEAAARKARYTKLADLLMDDEVLLAAHHRDDQAETVLLHLMRASGVSGLSGMQPESRIAKARFLRPLLDYGRADLQQYAEDNNLTWVEDATNASEDFARNFLRHTVLPEMEKRWPSASKNISRSAQWLREANTVLGELALADLANAATGKAEQLDLSALKGLGEARIKNLLRFWIESCGLTPFPQSVVVELINCIRQDSRSGHALVTWSDVEVHRYENSVYCMKSTPAVAPDWSTQWDIAKPLDLPLLRCSLDIMETIGIGLSRERLGRDPVLVKVRQGGERCRLPGRDHHHRLKNLLQEKRVPPWQRDRIPLLYVDEQLAAIGDYWVCEPFAAQKDELGFVIKMQTYSV